MCMVNIIEHLACDASFDLAAASLCIPGESSMFVDILGLVDKLGDIKVKKAAGACLSKIAESTSLRFVLVNAYPCITALKSPKSLADAFTWIQQALVDFGLVGIDVREVVEFLKKGLLNSNQVVRSAAISSLGTVQCFSKMGMLTG